MLPDWESGREATGVEGELSLLSEQVELHRGSIDPNALDRRNT
jgi:hypothetical protein